MGYKKSSYDEAKKLLSFVNANPEIKFEELDSDYFKKGLTKIDKLVAEISLSEKKLMDMIIEREEFFDEYIDNVIKYKQFVEKKFGKESKEAKEMGIIQPEKTKTLDEYENFAEEDELLKNKSKNNNNNKNKKPEQKNNTKNIEGNKNNNNKKVVKDEKKN